MQSIFREQIDGYLPYQSIPEGQRVDFVIEGQGLSHYVDGSDLLVLLEGFVCEVNRGGHDLVTASLQAGVFQRMLQSRLGFAARSHPRDAVAPSV